MNKPDRIDFTLMHDGRVIVLKFRRDETDPARPRDIPIPGGHDIKPAGFDLDAALDWCQHNGYAIRRWEGGVRAWKGDKPWVIRTREQIQRKRRRSPLSLLDFAYDG